MVPCSRVKLAHQDLQDAADPEELLSVLFTLQLALNE